MKFSEEIKNERKECKLSQPQFAKEFNIPLPTLRAWEQGVREPMPYTKSELFRRTATYKKTNGLSKSYTFRWKWADNSHFEISEYNGWNSAEIEATSLEKAQKILADKIEKDPIYEVNHCSYIIEEIIDIIDDADSEDERYDYIEKSITDMLNGNNSELKINQFCTLTADKGSLTATFRIAPNQTYVEKIKQTDDWQDVTIQICESMRKAFTEASQSLIENFQEGYVER